MTRPGHVSLGACDVFCDNIAPEKREMTRGGGLGSRPKKNVRGEIGDGVEYHLMKPTPRR